MILMICLQMTKGTNLNASLKISQCIPTKLQYHKRASQNHLQKL